MLYRQRPNAERHPGGQRNSYKDHLRVKLGACEMTGSTGSGQVHTATTSAQLLLRWARNVVQVEQ